MSLACALTVWEVLPIVVPRGWKWEKVGCWWGIRAVFRGASVLNLDAKGRMAMPAKYRDQLMVSCGGRLVVTVDRDRCLLLYPLPAWEEIELELSRLPGLDQNVRRLQRNLMGSSEELELDAQGRIRLPPTLREFAGLDKRVALVGLIKKFELWNEETWTQQRDAWFNGGDSEELNDALRKLPL
jgi:MraZ protein